MTDGNGEKEKSVLKIDKSADDILIKPAEKDVATKCDSMVQAIKSIEKGRRNNNSGKRRMQQIIAQIVDQKKEGRRRTKMMLNGRIKEK